MLSYLRKQTTLTFNLAMVMSDEFKIQMVRIVTGAVVAYLTMKSFQHMMKDLKPGNDRQRQAAESAKLVSHFFLLIFFLAITSNHN